MLSSNRRYPYYGAGYYSPGIMLPCFATVCCSFFGFGFCLMGLIMTATSYTDKHFPESPIRVIGPIFLCLGVVVVCVAIGLGCYTLKKKRAMDSETSQNQATQGASEPQPYSAFSGPNNPVPEVYDPEKRGLTGGMLPSSYGQTPASQMPYPMQEPSSNYNGSENLKPASDVSSCPPYSQPSYNPDFSKPPC